MMWYLPKAEELLFFYEKSYFTDLVKATLMAESEEELKSLADESKGGE